jgi:hypothetical protein
MIPYFPSGFFADGFPHSCSFPRPAASPLQADEDLAMLVAERLRRHLAGPAHRIVVEVQNRVVILEGVVATEAFRARAHHLVWRTAGVADVCNRLTTWQAERHVRRAADY